MAQYACHHADTVCLVCSFYPEEPAHISCLIPKAIDRGSLIIILRSREELRDSVTLADYLLISDI